jgi:hypothetical protein
VITRSSKVSDKKAIQKQLSNYETQSSSPKSSSHLDGFIFQLNNFLGCMDQETEVLQSIVTKRTIVQSRRTFVNSKSPRASRQSPNRVVVYSNEHSLERKQPERVIARVRVPLRKVNSIERSLNGSFELRNPKCHFRSFDHQFERDSRVAVTVTSSTRTNRVGLNSSLRKLNSDGFISQVGLQTLRSCERAEYKLEDGIRLGKKLNYTGNITHLSGKSEKRHIPSIL